MTIYAFGSNSHSQLGIGCDHDVASPIQCIFAGDQPASLPIQISAVGTVTGIISSNGLFYMAGNFQKMKEDSAILKKHSFDQSLVGEEIRFCAATWETVAAVTKGGKCYTWGCGEKGELGRGFNTRYTSSMKSAPLTFFQTLPSGVSVVDIVAGLRHTVVVLSNGEVYGWGNGSKGQLGQPSDIVWEPRRIEGLNFKVCRAVCGTEFTYLVGDPIEGRHVVLNSTDKWGIKSNAPDSVPGWIDIGASWGGIYALNQDGTLISWGRNNHGQLAPQHLPLIHQIAIGSEHAMALSRDGKVIVWGWGEHGNCGSPVDVDGDVRDRWNEIKLPEPQTQVAGISAGCATSWIWTNDH